MSNKYAVTFATMQLASKPNGHEANTFKAIHDELTTNPSENLALDELIERVERGQPFKNGTYEIDTSLTQAQKAELHDLRDTDVYKGYRTLSNHTSNQKADIQSY